MRFSENFLGLRVSDRCILKNRIDQRYWAQACLKSFEFAQLGIRGLMKNLKWGLGGRLRFVELRQLLAAVEAVSEKVDRTLARISTNQIHASGVRVTHG